VWESLGTFPRRAALVVPLSLLPLVQETFVTGIHARQALTALCTTYPPLTIHAPGLITKTLPDNALTIVLPPRDTHTC
jgi:hypothetical protein